MTEYDRLMADNPNGVTGNLNVSEAQIKAGIGMSTKVQRKLQISQISIYAALAVGVFFIMGSFTYDDVNISVDIVWPVLAFIAMVFANSKFRRLLTMVPFSTLVLAVTFLAPFFLRGHLYIAGAMASLVVTVAGFMIWYNRRAVEFTVKPFEPQWFIVIEPVILYLLGMYHDRNMYYYEAIIIMIVIFIGNIWCTYLQSTYQYFFSNRHTYSFPGKDIFKTNTNKMYGILGSSAVVLLLAFAYRRDEIFTFVAAIVVRVIYWVFLAFSSFMGLFMGEEAEKIQAEGMMPPMEVGETSPAAQVITAIISALVLGFVIWRLIIFIRDAVQAGKGGRSFVRAIDTGQEEEVEDIVVKEKKSSGRALDTRSRIRRKYKKTIEKNMKSIIPKGSTPKELSKEISKDKNIEKLDELTALYEKARYSNEDM